MITCLIIMGICLIALPLVKSDASLFLFAILFGFAFGGDVPQVPALTVHCFGVAAMGIIYPLIASTVNIGSALGPSIAGYIFDLTYSYTFVFLGLSVILFLGAFGISRIK
jgi:MFS family permease